MRRILSRAQSDRGQTIIFFVVAFTVLTVIGVFAFDFGLWFNSRRSLQTDVDMAALAGAQELAKDLSAVPNQSEDRGWALLAQDKAMDYLTTKNGLSPDTKITPVPPACPAHDDLGADSTDAFICVDRSCFAGDGHRLMDTVVVDAQGPAAGVFTRILNNLVRRKAVSESLTVGAHAKACVGSLTGTTGLRPWALSIYNSPCFEEINGVYMPKFGEDCDIRSDTPSSTGSIGIGPDLGDPCDSGSASGSDYKTNIINGSQSWCSIGDVISMIPGFKTGDTTGPHGGLTQLFATQGQCDAKFCSGSGCDGIDQFGEAFTPENVVPSPDVVYSARDCTTPRAVNIVILDEWCAADSHCSRDNRPIKGFAAFFITECWTLNHDGSLDERYPNCDMPGGDFLIRGRFMNILKLTGVGGPLDPYGTRVIFLAE